MTTQVSGENTPIRRRTRPVGVVPFLLKGMVLTAALFLLSATAAYCGLLT